MVIKSPCCICFNKRKTRGLQCDNEHFTCKDCFPLYVVSTCENASKLCDHGFVIRCPDPACNSDPWSTAQIRSNLNGRTLDIYIDTLIRFSNKNNDTPGKATARKESNVEKLLTALNIKCPRCKIVLDQSPDGCCAIRCGHCAAMFCWLCFRLEATSESCHQHVAECVLNDSGEVFAPTKTIEKAHKAHKIKLLQSILRDEHNSNGNMHVNWADSADTIGVLREIEQILQQNDIKINEILGKYSFFERFVRFIQYRLMQLYAIVPYFWNLFKSSPLGRFVVKYGQEIQKDYVAVWSLYCFNYSTAHNKLVYALAVVIFGAYIAMKSSVYIASIVIRFFVSTFLLPMLTQNYGNVNSTNSTVQQLTAMFINATQHDANTTTTMALNTLVTALNNSGSNSSTNALKNISLLNLHQVISLSIATFDYRSLVNIATLRNLATTTTHKLITFTFTFVNEIWVNRATYLWELDVMFLFCCMLLCILHFYHPEFTRFPVQEQKGTLIGFMSAVTYYVLFRVLYILLNEQQYLLLVFISIAYAIRKQTAAL